MLARNRLLVEEYQRGLRKPIEDAVAVPSGRKRRLREADNEY
jgi:hypothetical protein